MTANRQSNDEIVQIVGFARIRLFDGNTQPRDNLTEAKENNTSESSENNWLVFNKFILKVMRAPEREQPTSNNKN